MPCGSPPWWATLVTDDLGKLLLAELRELRAEVRSLKDGGRLLSRVEAAALLHVHPRTFDRMRVAGTVPPGRQVGRQWRWSAQELLAV